MSKRAAEDIARLLGAASPEEVTAVHEMVDYVDSWWAEQDAAEEKVRQAQADGSFWNAPGDK
jgi:hypothetical protein